MRNSGVDRLAVAVGTCILFVFAGATQAHHGFANHFDPDQEQTIEGTVTRFDFVNPHVTIYVDVESASGARQSWVAETGGSSGFLRNGRLSRDSIQAGDQIRISGHPARAETFELRANHIVLENGDELQMNNPYIPIPFLNKDEELGED